MTWIVDIDALGLEEAEHPDQLSVAFDVTYPGEVWCRSVVFVAPDAAYGSEDEIIGRARDALLAVVEADALPVSVELRLSAAGVTLLEIGHPTG
jgi:hypothetical protein